MSLIIEKYKLDTYKELPIMNMPSYLKSELDVLGSHPLKDKQESLLVFTTTNEEFFSTLRTLVKEDPIKDKGVLFLCYPKKGNPLYPSYVHRDEIFPKVEMDDDGFMFKSAYKFNRMLAFDEIFTVLEVKKIDSKKVANARPSHIGSDYIHHIPEVEAFLKDEPKALSFFQSLAAGYRKDWAVYVFSTENLETRNKRVHEMIRILKDGHKNMTLYRQSLKKQ
jgi:hypothetical protein